MVLIAEQLGISVATVSRALRPETADMVKESTRREILEISDRLKFVPNPGARLLQRGITQNLTIVIPPDEDVVFSQFYGRLLTGVMHAATGSGWEVRMATLAHRDGSFVEALRAVGQGSSGVIFAGIPLTSSQLAELAEYHRPLVLFRSSLPPGVPDSDVSCDVLKVDNEGGAIAAVGHLAGLGHKRIGILSGPVESRDFAERLNGYREGLSRNGLTFQENYLQGGSFDVQSGREGCRRLLGEKDPPTAILCANDSLAFGALDFSKEAGLSCPKQISIVGFDDGPWAQTCYPPLTTVRQPLARLAKRAVELIIAAATGESAPGKDVFPAELVVRGSTSSAPRCLPRIK